jgi:hypothetical protein
MNAHHASTAFCQRLIVATLENVTNMMASVGARQVSVVKIA